MATTVDGVGEVVGRGAWTVERISRVADPSLSISFPSHAANIHAANEQDSEVLGEGNGEWNGNGNGNGNPTVERDKETTPASLTSFNQRGLRSSRSKSNRKTQPLERRKRQGGNGAKGMEMSSSSLRCGGKVKIRSNFLE